MWIKLIGVGKCQKEKLLILDKLKNLIWFVFLYYPITVVNGIGLILLANERITGGYFTTKLFKKKNKSQIDKEKFAKMMKRICK